MLHIEKDAVVENTLHIFVYLQLIILILSIAKRSATPFYSTPNMAATLDNRHILQDDFLPRETDLVRSQDSGRKLKIINRYVYTR